jgi:hypothetical protein
MVLRAGRSPVEVCCAAWRDRRRAREEGAEEIAGAAEGPVIVAGRATSPCKSFDV